MTFVVRLKRERRLNSFPRSIKLILLFSFFSDSAYEDRLKINISNVLINTMLRIEHSFCLITCRISAVFVRYCFFYLRNTETSISLPIIHEVRWVQFSFFGQNSKSSSADDPSMTDGWPRAPRLFLVLKELATCRIG